MALMFNKELKQRMETAEQLIMKHEVEILALKESIKFLNKKINELPEKTKKK